MAYNPLASLSAITSPGGQWRPAPNPGPRVVGTPTTLSSGGGGYSGGGGGYNAAAAAAAAKAAAIETARTQALQARAPIISGAQVGVNTLENTYNDKTNQFTRDLQNQSDAWNLGSATNQLNLRRSMRDIASGVRQGLRSAGVSLANMNALDSGAAEAAARAYARVGGRQTGEARNTAALESSKLDTQAVALNRFKEDTIQSINQYGAVEVDRIGRETFEKLNAIDLAAEAQGVPPNAIDVMNDKNEITSDAIRRLAIIDARRAARIEEAKLLSPEEIMAKAIEMDQAGAAASPFQVEGPEVVAPGGPPLSQLPVLARPRDDEEGF